MHCRQLDNGEVEMKCTLKIACYLFERLFLGYKYVVYSPKMVNGSDCYECLNSVSYQPNLTRCLTLNWSDIDGRFLCININF